MTSNHWKLLAAIASQPGKTLDELAPALSSLRFGGDLYAGKGRNIDRLVAGGLIRHMVKCGYIVRTGDVCTVTEAGLNALRENGK